MTPEFGIELFRNLLSKGHTHGEIHEMFTREQISAALFPDGKMPPASREFLDLLVVGGMELRNEKDMEKAIELWLAGWTSEKPAPTTSQVMSWYWRRPPRTKKRPGRRYLSTDQAYNAMKKEQAGP